LLRKGDGRNLDLLQEVDDVDEHLVGILEPIQLISFDRYLRT
jgi:hypothetical protein